jgi:hypothetical protein
MIDLQIDLENIEMIRLILRARAYFEKRGKK